MKSIEQKFNEALDELRKKGKLNKFNEIFPYDPTGNSLKPSIEVQLNCAEALLSGKVEEAERAKRYVRKHNGAADNGHETFTESAWSEYQESTNDPREAQVKSYMATSRISEADARKVLGLPPKEIVVLGAHAVAEYHSAKRMRFCEADCIRLAKQRGEYMTEVLHEASR